MESLRRQAIELSHQVEWQRKQLYQMVLAARQLDALRYQWTQVKPYRLVSPLLLEELEERTQCAGLAGLHLDRENILVSADDEIYFGIRVACFASPAEQLWVLESPRGAEQFLPDKLLRQGSFVHGDQILCSDQVEATHPIHQNRLSRSRSRSKSTLSTDLNNRRPKSSTKYVFPT